MVAASLAQLAQEIGNARQNPDGSWVFQVATAPTRAHGVTVMLCTAEAKGTDISRVIAFAPIGAVIASAPWERILRRNADLDVGAIAIAELWTTHNTRRPYLVFRASHLAVTMDYLELWELVVKTANYADELEREIYSRDEF